MADDKVGIVDAVKKTLPVVKKPWFWLRDAQGSGSVTVTLVYIAFVVTTLAYMLAIFQKIGTVEIRPFDVAACGAYFVPILTLYFGRKFTDAKFKPGDMPYLPEDPKPDA
jgi:hypothetical protein